MPRTAVGPPDSHTGRKQQEFRHAPIAPDVALVGVALFLVGLRLDTVASCLLSKPLPMLALLVWLREAPAGAYRRWITIGLWLSLLGDMLLQWPADLFVFGLGAFLLPTWPLPAGLSG